VYIRETLNRIFAGPKLLKLNNLMVWKFTAIVQIHLSLITTFSNIFSSDIADLMVKAFHCFHAKKVNVIQIG